MGGGSLTSLDILRIVDSFVFHFASRSCELCTVISCIPENSKELYLEDPFLVKVLRKYIENSLTEVQLI